MSFRRGFGGKFLVENAMKRTEKRQFEEATQRILLIARQSTAGSHGVT